MTGAVDGKRTTEREEEEVEVEVEVEEESGRRGSKREDGPEWALT